MFHADFARHLLRDIDEAVRGQESILAEGRPQDFPAYREAVAYRRGLLATRAMIVARLSPSEARDIGLASSDRS